MCMKYIEDDNFVRNQVLQDLPAYMHSNGFNVSHIISFDELLNLRDKFSKKFASKNYIKKRNSAIKYLLAYEYLNYGIENGEGKYYVSITQKGLDACNSEYFYHEYKRFRRERINNRYTIAFGIITAFGVFFAIFKDAMWKTTTLKQPQEIIIKFAPKTLPLISDSIKIFSAPDHEIDSLKNQ